MSKGLADLIMGLSITGVITGVIVTLALVLARREGMEAILEQATRLFEQVRRAS